MYIETSLMDRIINEVSSISSNSSNRIEITQFISTHNAFRYTELLSSVFSIKSSEVAVGAVAVKEVHTP